MNKKYRKAIIAGNWKMNKTASEVRTFAEEIKSIIPKVKTCETVLCVPSVNISAAMSAFRSSRIAIGAQNMHYEAAGAFTGEVSAEMLSELGVKYVIIGHSERRQFFGETDFTVNKKVRRAIDSSIVAILCIGEDEAQRAMGGTIAHLQYQLSIALSGITAQEMRHVIIAYEPIWAIGTGNTATDEAAQEICGEIRTFIRKTYDARTARKVSILYGGSMNAENAAGLLAMPDIDGGLIGSASLKSGDFVQIISATAQEQA